MHISYILWGRNSTFGVEMHLGMAECHLVVIPYSSHCDLDLDLWPNLKNYCVWSISLIFFEVGIPALVCKCILDGNLVCECILEWRIVPFHFLVTVTLASDLVSRICIKSGANFYILLGRNSKLGVLMHLGMAECRVPFLEHCGLDLWPSF